MFDKVLIANRGEIAVRIIRACREMGIKTVAVFSEPDRDAYHTQLADEAVCIGPARASESYNNMSNIISAAVLTKSEAIHPGFGFLSENSTFAAMCRDCNIKFIGPSPEVIDAMGNKAHARDMMIKAGVPVIPGSHGVIKNPEEGKAVASELGYPVMLKASAGGGGKGIRIVRDPDDFDKEFSAASSEAKASFGDGSLYLEKVIEHARHIEVQVLADQFGNIIHLGERDCSLQRKHQKMLEESPCEILDQKTRESLCSAAVAAAHAAGYESAGTIEFMYKDGHFYFMEMNTRIQVEHPVSEMVSGVDIVKEQIRIAAGEKLKFKQEDIKIQGHAIECRINAEDPENGFIPSPGKIDYLMIPSGGPGLRVDTAVFQGCTVQPYYDSMIAKVIVHGRDRDEAVSKMRRALYEFLIDGVKTNIGFQNELLNNRDFIKGKFDTGFLDEKFTGKS